jgi:D-arabinono-1,4-lactone oxidase
MLDESHQIEIGIHKLVKLFCWVILGGAVVGLAAAHVPWIIGEPWSTCRVAGSQFGCALLFHLYEVPLVGMNIFIVWYGLKWFSLSKAPQFAALVGFMVVANAAFLTFEASLLMDSLRRGAPNWENYSLALVMVILITGCLFGIYVVHRLIPAIRTTD